MTLTNDQMTPGRFARMQRAKSLYKNIMDALKAGQRVQVTTYTKSTIYTQAEQFKADKYSVYTRHGKRWDCIDYCSVRAID